MTSLPGSKFPLGTCIKNDGVNFAVFSDSPELSLLLFYPEQTTPFLVLPFNPCCNKTGSIWHMFVKDLSPPFEYLYQVVYQNNITYVHDPYAKGLSSTTKWGITEKYEPKGRCFIPRAFDWEGVKKPNIPLKDLIIYEMHLRGFTQDSSSDVIEKGTFLGMIYKIPHLLSLGINAVELLPVFEFNECENPRKPLCNFWGYSTVNFFCPMQRYTSSKEWDSAIIEFKTLVKELHKNGISVILDVVYNHTAEQGNENESILSFKGLAKKTYYSFNSENEYFNFSGTGNTLNCNHPVVSEFIIDSLSYWAEEMQVDGFRFDLASIFSRDSNGSVLSAPPVLKLMQQAPLLQDCLLIAEAWDAVGLYQVGCFPGGPGWSDWNGKYRDTVRRFVKGVDNQVAGFMQALCGSQELYWKGSPLQSINFITCHDGFTLCDLVTYQQKHNEANKEDNRDGMNDNESWNCGVEGETDDPAIILLRKKQMKNFQMILLLSIGIPMIFMGDEYGHSKQGNNNTYCHDNKLNWFLWDKLKENNEFFSFIRNLIAFRKEKSHLFCKDTFLEEKDIHWINADWNPPSHFISYILKDPLTGKDCLVAFNADHNSVEFSLPSYTEWSLIADTSLAPPLDFIAKTDQRPILKFTYLIASRSAIIAEAICSR